MIDYLVIVAVSTLFLTVAVWLWKEMDKDL